MATKKMIEFMIVNRRSGKALQATGLDNGLVVEQAAPVKSDAQTWYMEKTGEGVKLYNKAASKVLDVMANGTADGTWVQTWEDVGGESQFWQVVAVSSTYKKLVHTFSGKVLDIVDMGVEDGVPAQIWEDVSGENQQWKFVSLEEKPATQTVKKTTVKKATAKKTPAAKEAGTKEPAAKKTASKAAKAPEKKTPAQKTAAAKKAEPKEKK